MKDYGKWIIQGHKPWQPGRRGLIIGCHAMHDGQAIASLKGIPVSAIQLSYKAKSGEKAEAGSLANSIIHKMICQAQDYDQNLARAINKVNEGKS